MGVRLRWLIAVLAALACFLGCWAGLSLEQEHVLDTGTQAGVASVPLVVVLTVLGAWAERARDRAKGDKGGTSARAAPTVRDSHRRRHPTPGTDTRRLRTPTGH